MHTQHGTMESTPARADTTPVHTGKRRQEGEAMTDHTADAPAPVPRAKPGRKPDPTRDAEILDVALEVLAEVGYAGMTLAAVAERARAGKATFYRRWPSKEDLGLDAVARLKGNEVDIDDLPDTGVLRTDLLGLFKPASVADGERNMRVMTGLASLLLTHPLLAEAASSAIVDPWAAALSRLMFRAADRGEIRSDAAIAALARIVPEMAAYRSLVQRKPFELSFLTEMIDEVLIPALATKQPPTPH
jgi:AcrR family transcriptional regulator